jgi:arylsulfatase A-like enzyme
MRTGKHQLASPPIPPARSLRGRLRPALLATAFAAAACGRPPAEAPRPRNVILVSIDTLRADHLGAFGYARDTSPFIDGLARRGVRFERAFAPASWTLPSHMSLLTSTYPHTHRVENVERVLPDATPTLAERLRDAGYHTTAFVSWVYLSAAFGFGRGFDGFHELLPPPEQRDAAGHHAIRAGPFVDRVLEWARQAPAEPYFLFLHLFDPHMSYEPPLEIARRFDPALDSVQWGDYEHLKRYIRGLSAQSERVPAAERERARALYDGEIRYVDGELQRLFDGLGERGLLAHTLVVLVSDHGEEFDEHGSMEGHGWTLYDEVLRVPLILAFPDGRDAGRSVPRVVQTLDVAPTILHALGLEPPPDFQGRSLLPLLDAEPPEDWPDVAFGQTQRFNIKWSLRTARHKLVFTLDTRTNRFGVPVRPGFELYDLERDRGEQIDIWDETSPEAQELAARLEAFARSKRELSTERPRLTDSELRRLRALGYAGDER